MELELTTSKDFYTLSTNIYKTISLNTENRGVDGIAFLNTCFQEYSELVQKSSMLRKKINDKMVPHKIGLLESIYNLPSHLTGDMIPHLNLPEMSTEINSMTSNLSEEISKEEEEDLKEKSQDSVV